MNTLKELVDHLNELNLTQTSGTWEEDIPPEIWENYIKYTITHAMADGLDVDTHRWYETSISVYKVLDGFLGVRYLTNLFSESMDWEDCYHTLQFFEMEEIQITSYKPKGQ